MAITFTVGAFASGTAGLTVSFPAGVAVGDLLVCAIETAAEGGSISTAGWTGPTRATTGTAATAGAVDISVYRRIADGTEGASIAVLDSGNHTTAAIVCVKGQFGTTIADALGAGGSGSGVIAAASLNWTLNGGSTGLETGYYPLVMIANDLDLASSNNVTSVTNANFGTHTRLLDQTIASGVGGGLSIWNGGPGTASSPGAHAAVSSTSNTAAYVIDYYKAAVAPTLMGQACL